LGRKCIIAGRTDAINQEIQMMNLEAVLNWAGTVQEALAAFKTGVSSGNPN